MKQFALQLLVILAVACATASATPDDAQPLAQADCSPMVGRLLRDVLNELREQSGLDVIYSSDFVKPYQSIKSEPPCDSPRTRVAAAAREHGLALRRVDDSFYVVRDASVSPVARPASLLVIVRDEESRMRVDGARIDITDSGVEYRKLAEGAFLVSNVLPGRYSLLADAPAYQPRQRQVVVDDSTAQVVSIVVSPTSEAHLENIVVSTSRYDVVDNPYPQHARLTSEQMDATPSLGGDPLRVMRRLPGAASGGLSAKVHFRGGAFDETLLVLDGQELVDPFHLRDYQSLFSAIDQKILADVDVYTGGFPASYGDALSGVIAMRSLEPVATVHEVAIDFFNSSLLSVGTFGDADGEWLFSARRGNLDMFIDSIDPSFGDPNYSDLFGRLGYRLGERSSLSINALASRDNVLVVTEALAAEREEARSDTDNAQVWFTLQTEWTPNLYSQSVLSFLRLKNHRRGVARDPELAVGEVDDRRKMRRWSLKQDWTWRSGRHQQTRWGLKWTRLDASYDYLASAEFFDLAAALTGSPAPLSRRSLFEVQGDEINLYVSQRIVATRNWLAEVGLRWDTQSYADISSQTSPRANVLYRASKNTDVRLSFGRFYQSQPIHALQVEDSVEQFFPAQRADQIIVGVEHRFKSGVGLRVEAYRKLLSDLRPRFENLLDPLIILPELAFDRVRIEPQRARVSGVELSLAQQFNASLSWWASYTRSRATDRVNGRDVPRSWDQPHAFSAGATWRRSNWEASIAAGYRSGWPTTPVVLNDGEPAFAERNSGRLADFSSIDLHIARHFTLPNSRLTVSFDVVNVTDRRNPCCVDYDIEETDAGEDVLIRELDHWLPLMPSLGVRWTF